MTTPWGKIPGIEMVEITLVSGSWPGFTFTHFLLRQQEAKEKTSAIATKKTSTFDVERMFTFIFYSSSY
jgi:hypothetical protein